MQIRNILEDRLLTVFPRVLTPSIYTEMIEIQADFRDWADLLGRILERYNYDESLQLSKKDIMYWVDNPGKGQNSSTLLQEFESRFTRLSTLD